MKYYHKINLNIFIYIVLSFVILTSSLCNANSINDSIYIKKYAGDFLNSRFAADKSFPGRKSINEYELKQVYISDDTCKNRLYGFLVESGGYVFAIDNDTSVIIPAYSLKGKFDPDNIAPSLMAFIKAYESSEITVVKNVASLPKGSVTPLLETENIIYNQVGVYNDACPWDEEASQHALAGCVAVAMAQIMRYHKHPATGSGSHSYMHPEYGLISADFGETTYNWANMPGSISEPNADVAKLLFHAGVSVDMNYTPSQSGASTLNVAPAFRNYFRYPNAMFADRDYFSAETGEYHTTLRNELNNNRPFYFGLTGGNNDIGWSGHAVVVDGYNDDYFHINFGWGGSENGYFIFSGIVVIGSYQFGFNGNSVIQITPVPTPANVQDSLALVALYNSTGGINWTNKTNWLTGNLASWHGVDVIDGRVIHLILNENNLSGTIPSELGNLTELTNLNLGSNNLNGSIPKEIGNMTNLISLSLAYNSLTGPIPGTIGNCVSLRYLNLGSNKLEGPIPEDTGNLLLLERIYAYSNLLTGSFPEILCNLTSLKSLDISDNQFTGSLPSNLGNMSLLTDFQINKNQFSGAFPESISAWTNLTMFRIDDNLFEGQVPAGIGNFSNLIILSLDNNRFTSLPEEIGNLNNLTWFTAQNNRLGGTLTSGIGGLVNLQYLDLNDNLIEALPPESGNLVKLERLTLTNNLLETLPPETGNLTSLTHLYLAGNRLTELPYEIGRMNNLANLYASNNMITELTFGISMISKLIQAELSFNYLSEPLPPLSHLGLSRFNIDHNNLTFEDIATAKLPDDINYYDSYDFYYRYQGSVKLSKNEFSFSPGDSVGIDVCDITDLNHPGNIYTWFKNGNEFSSGPLLLIKDAKEGDQGNYYCAIDNSQYTKLTINTDTLILKLTEDGMEQVADTIISKTGSPLRIADEKVKLLKPDGLRGDLTWQASLDTINWINLTGTITNPDISQNISNIYSDSLILTPQKPALYRYLVNEDDCDPLYSDTLLIEPYVTKALIDTLLNVDEAEATVTLENIEIIIPHQMTEGDFRLTVDLIETPPAAPDSVKSGPVFDVKLSCGSVFSMPITIKMDVQSDSLLPVNLDRFMTVYHNDEDHEWIPYESSSISMRDSSIIFETYHLTKLTWWEKQVEGSRFTDKFERDSVTVYYQEKFSYLTPLYDKNQSEKPWHLTPADPEYGTPLMIQDMAQFTLEVMRKFKSLGLSVPRSITIYADNIDDYGVVGLMGMTNGYITISLYIEEPDLLRSVIAHEYMHYTQDYYILAHPGNIFWMEANGHTADRMVWDTDILPVSESDNFLMENRKGKNSIFHALASSWDYWDSGLLTQNLFGNIEYCYLAGCFIHYMRSYRQGTTLKPETLLKETPITGSWKEYLDSYATSYLSSSIGKEYEEYVKYIIIGENPGFSLLNNGPDASGDALSFLNQAPEEFSRRHLYKIPDDQDTVVAIKETLSLPMPYLSTQMEQFYNLSMNRSICVKYKRTHEDTTNIKVFLCNWDAMANKYKMTDISRIDSSFFFLEASTKENVDTKVNQAHLLFINKSSDKQGNPGYELEILPVADFNYLYNLDISYGTVFDAPIHNFSDGIKRRLVIVLTSTDIARSKVYTENSFTVTSVSPGNTQTIEYQFRTGNMIITENKQHVVEEETITENTTFVLRDIFLTPFEIQYASSGIYGFQTTSTSETVSKIVSISYNYSDSGTSYSYVSTDWSVSPDIRINLQFK